MSIQQPSWQGNQFQMPFTPAPNVPTFSYTPEPTQGILSLLSEGVAPQGLLGAPGGDNNTNSPHSGPASPEGVATQANAIGTMGGLFGMPFGISTLGSIAGKATQAAMSENIADAFKGAYGLSANISPNFSVFGFDVNTPYHDQIAAHTPQVNDAGFGGPGQPSPSAFGRGSHPGETDGAPGGGASGAASASAAGANDGPDSPGPFHNGGLITDNRPDTYKDNYRITAQEGEYVLPRGVVKKLGVGLLDDMIRRLK